MKRMFLDIEKAQKPLNWQETGKFEELNINKQVNRWKVAQF